MKQVRDILLEIGIKITSENESGFAQFRPIYRGSNNDKGASINLYTGLVTDWSQGETFSIDELYNRVTGLQLNKDEIELLQKPPKEQEDEDRVWSEKSLIYLLPNHSYWMNRGISKETLNFFKGGVSHSGKLINRYVWPVYDKYDRIIGFTGRDLTGESEIKYKHEGKSTKFIFGVFNKKDDRRPILDSIFEKNEVILVEGPSDSVSCYDEGLLNVIPTIGLNISRTLLNFLLGINPKKIIIAYNKDENFRGQDAAVKNFAKLAEYFSVNSLSIKYPEGNDLSENKNKILDWSKKPCLDRKEIKEEFRNKYKRCEKNRLMKVKGANKMTQQEIKIGKTL